MKTAQKTTDLLLAALFVMGAMPGCALLSNPGAQKHDNAARLIARPDFDAARAAAPEWCRDALKTINALEYELERK